VQALFCTGWIFALLGDRLLAAGMLHALDAWIWAGIGMALLIASLGLFGILLLPGGWRPGSRRIHKAGLVVSPEGMCYAEGCWIEEVCWDEVFDMVLRSNPSSDPERRALIEVMFLPLAITEPLADTEPDLPTIAHVLSLMSSFTILDCFDHPRALIFKQLHERREAALAKEDAGESRRSILDVLRQGSEAIRKPPDGPIKPA
jgi:hypothetical protein